MEIFVLAILVVFDFTKTETLYNCKTWLNEALTASSSLCPFIFLVGTKLDLMVNKDFALSNKFYSQHILFYDCQIYLIYRKNMA